MAKNNYGRYFSGSIRSKIPSGNSCRGVNSAKEGLAVVGFPANEFGKQEPGTNEEIAAFCEKNYGVKFDMFSKIVVKGDGQCELYKFLTSKETNPKFSGEIKWNFEKFLIGRNGEIVARFGSKVKPDAAEVSKAIEEELKSSAACEKFVPSGGQLVAVARGRDTLV